MLKQYAVMLDGKECKRYQMNKNVCTSEYLFEEINRNIHVTIYNKR